MIKKTFFTIIVLCLILFYLIVYIRNKEDLYLSDAKNLIETVELTHPAFSLDDVPERYEAARNSLISEAESKMTRRDFKWSVQKYLSSLNDGHTGVEGRNSSRFIDVNWQAVGDQLFLLDKEGMLTTKEIESIGNVSVSDIFAIIDLYFPRENHIARERNRTLWSRSRDILLISGRNINLNKVLLRIKDGEEVFEETYNIRRRNIYGFYNHSLEISSERIGDVFYIEYNRCNVGRQLTTAISRLEQALSDGITSIIIDVRNNPGGNTEANKLLLEALGMSGPQYGIYLRYSPLLSKQWRIEENSGYRIFSRDLSTTQKNDDIDLVILTNVNTYSAATNLAVTVQDGSLGKIIGQSSSNAPNSYGDVLFYNLPNSNIKVRISCKRFLRPDVNANPDKLIPDIITEYNEDALDVALNFLNEN